MSWKLVRIVRTAVFMFALGAVVMLVVAHLGPVRARALAWARDLAARDAGLTVDAAGLDYNVLTRSLRLIGVSVAARPGEPPFFRADELGLVLSPRVYRGVLEVQRVELHAPRVHIVRHADGTTNLPASAESDAESGPLNLGVIEATALSVAFDDEGGGYHGALGPVDLTLDTTASNVRPGAFGPAPFSAQIPAVGSATGRQALEGTVAGRLGFDGTTLDVQALDVTAAEGRVSLEGSVAIAGADPQMDVRSNVELSLAPAARFAGPSAGSLAGTLAARLVARGPIADPVVQVDLEGRELAYRGMSRATLTAVATVTARNLELRRADLTSPVGTVTARGDMAFAGTPADQTGARIAAEWRGVDLDRAIEAAGVALPIAVGATSTGRVDFRFDFEPGWWGRLAGTGSARLQPGGRGLSVDGTLDMRVSAGQWSLPHALRSPTAGITLAGTVAGDLREREGGTPDSSLRGETRLNVPDLGTVEATLTSAGVALPPALVGRLSGSLGGVLHPEGTLSNLRVRASASGREIPIGNLQGIGVGSVLVADSESVRVQSLSARRGTASVTASGRYLWTGRFDAKYEAQIPDTSEITEALLVSGPAVTGGIRLTGEAWGTAALPEAKGQVTGTQLVVDDTVIGTLRADLAFSDWTVHAETETPDIGVRARGTIGARAPYAFDATADFSGTSLPGLLPPTIRDQTKIRDGRVSGSARATGTVERPLESAVEASLSALDLDLAGTPVRLEGPGRVTLTPDRVAASGLALRVGEQARLAIAGSLSRAGASEGLDVRASGPLSDLIGLATAFSTELPAVGDGTFDAELRVEGTLRTPRPAGLVQARAASLRYADYPALDDVRLEARVTPGAIVVNALDAGFQSARLSGSGTLPLRLVVPSGGLGPGWADQWLASLPPDPARASFSAKVTDITPAALAGLVSPAQLQQIKGRITASVTGEAADLTLEAVRATLTLDEASMVLAEVPAEQVAATRVQLEGGYARIEDFRWEIAGNPVYVTGGASLAGSQTLDLSIVGALDLRMLSAFVEGIATAGSARTDVWVTGSFDAPVIVGRAAIAEGELRVETPPLVASDLEGSISIGEDRMLSLALDGLANGGDIRLTGSVDLTDPAAPSGRASLSADNVVLDYPDGLQTESEVELTLTLTPPSGALLSGTIGVLAGTYREPLLVTQGLLAGLGQALPAGSGESSWLSTLRLDVTVTTTDDLRIDNNYGRLGATANLRLTGTAARPGMIGRIEATPDGEIYLAGNTFRIETLILDLADPRAIAPNVTFLAETRVGNTDIEVALECRAAGPCERDVRSLTTGVTNAEAEQRLFGAPEDAAEAGERLAQLLSGEILGVVGRTVGLDTLRLESGSGAADIFNDPTLVAGDIDPASRLTLGKRLGRNVELVFSQNLAESGFTWSTTYFGGLGTSYRALLLDDQSRSYEFRHEPRFGSTRRERAPRQPGPRVTAIRFGGVPGFPEDDLRGRLGVREGDRFEFTALQVDRDRLADFYHERDFLEARIRARREAGPDDTVVLDYTIERGPATSIVVSGADLPSDVLDRIASRWSTTVFDAFLERDARLIVRAYLFGQGHLEATVEASMSRDAAMSTKTLRVEASPGPILTRRLAFEGDSAIPRVRLDEATAAIGEFAAWLDPPAFEEGLRRFYGREGFLGAGVTVHPPAVANGESVVRVEISEGQPWSVGRITIGGAEAAPSVLQAFELASGAPYKPAVVEEELEQLEDRLRAEGYLDVNGVAETVLRPEQRVVDVHVLVQAGPRSVISEVIVEGADPSSAPVARSLKLSPGQAASPEAIAETRRQFYGTGLFRSVDIEVEPVSRAGSDNPAPVAERPVVARVRVQERPQYRFRYGLVLSDEVISAEERDVRLGAALDLERRNLFQRAITAGLSGRFRPDQQIGRAFLGADRFFGLPLSSTLFLSRERESRTANIELITVTTIGDVTELSVEQGYRPGRFTELRYGYGFGRNRTRIEGPGQDFDLSVRVARMTASALVDRRRDPFNPTGGWFASGSLELSKEGLGSDISFLKSFLQYFQFVDLGRRLVFGSTVRLGLAAPIDGNDVLIPSEQFFAGGATTVRGYREDDLGPRSIFGDAEGGNAMFVLNEEIRFPVRGRLRGVGFVDVGNVFPTVSEIDLGSLQIGTGAGLRYDSPIGILRLDFAVPVNPREFDRNWTVYFGLGQAF